MIDVSVPEGSAEAWLSRPPDDREHPGVLFFMDAFGIRPQLEEMAERIASWGYVVLVPHVFHRDGTVAELAPTVDLRDADEAKDFFAKAFGRVRALTPDRAEPDVAAYVDALRAVPEVGDGPIGTTGYCMGARLALRAACVRPDEIAACAGFHGGGLATEDDTSPHLGLPRARAAFVFAHADHDRSMPPEAIARLGRALEDAGLEHVNEVYAGAAHGYTMADTSAYDETAAERHYAALRDLLGRQVET
jgi:carboxymethylenebutenolidase